MSRKINQIRMGSVLSYVNLAIGNIVPIFYTPIMLSILGASEYGLYTLAHSVVGYLSLLSFGIGGTIVRYLAKARAEKNKDEERRIFGLFIKVYLVLSVLVLVVGAIASLNAGLIFGAKIEPQDIEKMQILMVMMTINTAITFPTSVFSSLIIAHERFVFNKLLAMLYSILAPCLNLALLFCGFGSVGLTASTTIITIITFVFNAFYCVFSLKITPSFKKTAPGLLKEIVGFSAFIFLGEIVNMLYWATDKVLLGAMVGTTAVAVYNVGATFNTIMQSLGTAVSGMFAPRIVINTIQGDQKYLDDLFIRIGRIQYYIIALILTGFAVFGRQFVNLWVGAEYADAYVVALMVMIPLAVPLIQSVALQIIIAKNKHQFRAISFLCVAILNIIGTILLIPYMGIVGAALASCIAYMIGPVFLMNWYYDKKIGIDIKGFWKSIIKICPVSLGLLVAGFAFTYFVELNSWITLLSSIILYTVLYAVLSWVLTMNDYEKDIFLGPIKKIIKKLRGKKS